MSRLSIQLRELGKKNTRGDSAATAILQNGVEPIPASRLTDLCVANADAVLQQDCFAVTASALVDAIRK